MKNEVQTTVLVTGFGPFGNYKVNPSWEAVKLLPKLFDESEKSDIKLIIEEIAVAYESVSSKVKELWQKHRPSIIVHVGVSYVANCLTIECQANSKGYNRPDVFDKCPKEENIDHITLKTKCNVQDLCEIVSKKLEDKNCKVCISYDAGRYLCEYIYYQSLSIEEPQVLFIHVPETKIYPIEKTAQGLFEILVQLIACTCNNK
ncbi:hypothetical protein TSAR_006264 [Trichomalopsis sarcophagae]|uniref:Pyroglutamyl-peptidase I n=1 Tax=Trichomalopsis sarcophagae TaxID=543379 RepID=A0A232F0R1_9HYME|nr:hypothetical protein TSAR_006264 [Trichomalopsis sarcophagae]